MPLVEAGELDSPRTHSALTQYLAPLMEAGIDQLVLGCTHYPFLRPLIGEIAGAGVAIIDPAPAVARQAGRVLAQHGWLATEEAQSVCGSGTEHQRERHPAHRFYTTGGPIRFQVALRDLLGMTTDVGQAIWQQDDTLKPAR